MNKKLRNKLKRERGAALVAAMIFTLVGTMVVAGTLVYTSQHQRLSYNRRDSEAALMLANAGINQELRRLSALAQQGEDKLVTANNNYPTGQKYPGVPGTLSGVPGKIWVRSTSDSAGNTLWKGENTIYITAWGEVNGVLKKVQVSGTTNATSLFTPYALFGVDSVLANKTSTISLSSGSGQNVTVEGSVGTNGTISKGSNTVTWTTAVNFNRTVFAAKPTTQFTGSGVYNMNDRLAFPTVLSLARQEFGLASNTTRRQVWAAVKSASRNMSTIMTMKTDKATDLAALSPTVVKKATQISSGFEAYKLLSSYNGGRSAWTNTTRLKDGRYALILQPGDYYFESVELFDETDYVLIFDNAGKTVAGGNPTKKPIRIWFGDWESQTNTPKTYCYWYQDFFNGPVEFTDPNDPSTVRICYGKEDTDFTFKIKKPSGNCKYKWTGVIYTCSGGDSPNTVTVDTDSPNTDVDIFGALIADRIVITGNVRIKGSTSTDNPDDPKKTFQFNGNYREL